MPARGLARIADVPIEVLIELVREPELVHKRVQEFVDKRAESEEATQRASGAKQALERAQADFADQVKRDNERMAAEKKNLEQSRKELERDYEAVQEASDRLRQREKAADERDNGLKARAAELESMLKPIDERDKMVAKRESEVERQKAVLSERERAITERENKFAEKARQFLAGM